jgi:hypothetical protein
MKIILGAALLFALLVGVGHEAASRQRPSAAPLKVAWNRYEEPPPPPVQRPVNPRSSLPPYPVRRPAFPDRTVNVRDHGARGDGATLDTAAINKAVAACARAGGGRVLVPAGRYVTGSIRLQSNINLHLAQDAVLIGAPFERLAFDHYEDNPHDPADKYTQVAYNHWTNSLIYALGAENVAVTGPGVIHGGGLTRKGARADIPQGAADKGITLRECRRVLLKDFTLIQGGHIAILNMATDDLAMENLTVQTTRDGVHIIGCRNVDMYNCYVEGVRYENGQPKGGDDAIVFKSTYSLGRRLLTENVSIRNCVVNGGTCNAVWFGSETWGDFRNIRITDINVLGADKSGIGISSNDGAVIENVIFKNVTMQKVHMPVCVRITNRQGRAPDREVNPQPGVIRGVRFEDITATDCAGLTRGLDSAIDVSGWPGARLEDLTFRNVRITFKGGHPREEGAIIPYLKNIHEPNQLGPQPAWAFRFTYAKDIRLENVNVDVEKADLRPALFAHKVDGLLLDGFRAEKSAGAWPLVRLVGVTGFAQRRSPALASGEVKVEADRDVPINTAAAEVNR